MKKIYALMFTMVFTTFSYSQLIRTELGETVKDSITIYQITEIEEYKDEYIIHAIKDEYHFRIKSNKESNCNCTNYNQLQVGKYFQLDIRNYGGANARTLYSTKYKGMGFCTQLYNNQWLCEYIYHNKHQYSQVLNLKGLCLVKTN